MHLLDVVRQLKKALSLVLLRAVCNRLVAIAVGEDGLLHSLAGHLVAKGAVHVRLLLRPFLDGGAGDLHAEFAVLADEVRALVLFEERRPEFHCAVGVQLCVVFDV